VGGVDPPVPAGGEPTVKYHPVRISQQTPNPEKPGGGPSEAVSLSGAVSTKRVTEEYKGGLRPVGNRSSSARVEARLTARGTPRAGAKAGPSDPAAWMSEWANPVQVILDYHWMNS
jgi:hypothetical protein